MSKKGLADSCREMLLELKSLNGLESTKAVAAANALACGIIRLQKHLQQVEEYAREIRSIRVSGTTQQQ